MKIKRESINSSLSYFIIIPLIVIVLLIVNKKENTAIKYDVCHNLKEEIFTLDKKLYITSDSVFNHLDLNLIKQKIDLKPSGCGGDLITYSSDIGDIKKLKLIYNTPRLCPGIRYRNSFNIILRKDIPLVENNFIKVSSIGDSLTNYLLKEKKNIMVFFDFKKNDNSEILASILDEIIRGYSVAYDSLSYKQFKKPFCSLSKKEIKNIKLDFKLTIPTKEGLSGKPPPPPPAPKIDVIEVQ